MISIKNVSSSVVSGANRVSLSALCLVSAFVLVVAVLGLVVTTNASAAIQDSALGDKKQNRVPALRSRVYEQLARAQKTGDEGDVQGAIAILDEVKAKASSMNSYERAMMYNFYGFIYYAQEDFDNTIASFKAAVNESPIPVKFKQTALYSLAQLSMAQGNYADVIDYIERWEALNKGKIPPKNYILKSQALYQGKRYEEAAGFIELAIKGHEDEGYLADENWLILQRAIYFEMKDPVKVKQIIIKLIRLYDAAKYWIQLAGMYGELEQEKQQLATMEIAYQRGFITTASDTYNLAQLYYYHGVPYKGAALMEQAIESGQLQANLRNLKFLGQAWQRAQEDTKAVPVMQEAAALSDEGELDAQLSLLLYNLDDFDKAIAAGKQAIQKGGLNRPGDTHVVIGLSLYNQGQFALALEQLSKAEQFSTSKTTARQWSKYVQREQRTAMALQALNSGP